ncbi:E3 binding domain-containing protein [Natrinema gelatinilyticum]|uniref:E3 binding domain-containing protein n=1 Tax=Natrinema gelatinilyticum TaxID=2961571 RepID=UPI0020C27F83|nr:E3 binding domain-containing protein [Natrinema gelatinilyticum]
MASIIKMPKLGLEMEQGTVLEWLFEPGDEVSEGDKMTEVESEKSIGEVEAREDGILRRIYVKVGEAVPPGKPIGILAEADADISDLEAEVEAELEGEAEEDTAASEESGSDADARLDDDQAVAAAASPNGGTIEVKASPRAQKQAEEIGVDLTTVDGTGPMGSITADDVEAAADDSGGSAESVKASPKAKKRAEELDVDLTTVDGTGPMDSITAEDVETAAEAPSASEAAGIGQAGSLRFQHAAAIADPTAGAALLDTTEAVRSAFEERVTITDVLLVVASAALEDRPLVNGTYTESTHQLQESQDIALVTEFADDLSTAVIPNVDDKSLTEIVAAREAHADDSDEQPSFTLANTTDTESEGLLVNQPGVAALAVDPSGQRAVPTDDGVDLQPLVTASLTYDTHAIDGTEAEAFLDQFFERAEQASELILGSYRGKE